MGKNHQNQEDEKIEKIGEGLSGPSAVRRLTALDTTQAVNRVESGHNCRLEIISGLPSKAFEISKYPTPVGRLESCPVSLAEPHISRLHFQLDFATTDQKWFLTPEPDAGPVLINGKQAQPQQILCQGDLISVGLVTLRFLFSEGEPASVSATNKVELEASAQSRDPEVVRDRFLVRYKREVVSMSVIAGILGLAFLIFAVSGGIAATAQDDAATAQAFLDEATAKYMEGQLDSAQALVNDSLGEHVLPSAEQLAATLKREQARKENLEQAKKLFETKSYDSAAQALNGIGENSIFSDQKSELMAKIVRDYSEAIVVQAKALDQKGALDEGLKLVQGFLEKYPNVALVKELKDGLLAEQQLLQSFKREVVPIVQKSHFKRAIVQAEAYAARGLEEAPLFAQNLKLFEPLLSNGRRFLTNREVEQAVESLRQAYDMLPKITFDSVGSLTKTTTQLFVNALYLQAFSLKESGDQCKAAELIWRARTLGPENANARSLAAEFLGQAKRMYAQASQESDAEQASRIAEKALCLVPADSDTALKLAGLVL